MHTYKIFLHQGGALQHQMQLSGLTAAEVILLRRLHGESSVKNIQVDGEKDLLNEEVRLYLNKKFGQRRVQEVFGDMLVELPEKLNETVLGGVGRGGEAALEEAAKAKRAKRKKAAPKKAKAEEPAPDAETQTEEPASPVM